MAENRIVTADEDFPIQPHDINASGHMFEAFDNMETEISAGWIIRFLQSRDQGWNPFTHEEINNLYSRTFQHGFRFNRLVEAEMVPPSLARAFAGHHDPLVPKGGGWIIKGDDDKYYVTVDFITRCFKSCPASPSAVRG